MVDDPDFMSAAYVAGGGGLAWLAQAIWQRFFTKEGKGHDALVQQLSDRITAQESRLQSLESGLDAERDARRSAEDKVHALELDNMVLRAELSRHGIDIPPAKYAVKG